MKNTFIGVAVGAVVVLVIGGVYVAVRQDIRKASVETQATAEKAVGRVERATREGLQEGIKSGVDTAGQKARQLPREILDDILASVGAKAADAAAAEGENAKKGDQAPAAGGGFRLPIPKGPFQPQKAVQDAFELGRQVAQQVDTVLQDVLPVTDSEENELGRKFHKLLADCKPVWNSADALARVQRLADPLLERRQRKAINYTFTLIDDPNINAASIPGGFIYLNRGLIDFVQHDAELQFVLGHEIGHVDLKHCVRNFTYAVQAGKLGGQPVEIAVGLLYRQYEVSFSEQFEFDADAYGFRRLVAAGCDRDDALRFPRRFLKHLQGQGESDASLNPESVPSALKQEVLNHFRTHPPTEDRLRRLEAIPVPKAANQQPNPDKKPNTE
jgi:hypothetical protein